MSSTATTPVTEIPNYFGGAWQKSSATEFVDVTNPASGELIARTPLSSKAEVDTVVQAAAAAFPAWRRTPAGERIQYLFKLKVLLEEHIDELSRLITLENGKTFGEAKAELRRGIENVEVACGIPMMMQGYNLEDITPGVDETLIRQPLGSSGGDRAVQFSGDDSVLVFAIRDCVRKHVCVEAERACAGNGAPDRSSWSKRREFPRAWSIW